MTFFSGEDTGLFWNKMPHRNFLAKQDKSAETQNPVRTGLFYCLIVIQETMFKHMLFMSV